ncbi:MAG: TIGR00725 family protein [Planctomycetota bacterium]|nr:MAG: TIGR00725 family protein [Planctomycetota bacterium]
MSGGPLVVAVIGAGRCGQEVGARAEAVGRALAEAGCVLVCGGLGGVMEASCRGAHEAGGLTVGILPGRDPQAANPYVHVPIATGLGEARNAVIAQAARGAIAIAGGWGTLSEIALCRKLGKPVVSLDSWRPDETVRRANSPEDAVAQLLAAIGR